jgi:hypothetical protein
LVKNLKDNFLLFYSKNSQTCVLRKLKNVVFFIIIFLT